MKRERHKRQDPKNYDEKTHYWHEYLGAVMPRVKKYERAVMSPDEQKAARK